jgi:hypothetical protein
MRQARLQGGRPGYRQAGRISSAVSNEYAAMQRFYGQGMGDPWLPAILGTIGRLGGGLIKKLAPGLFAGAAAETVMSAPDPIHVSAPHVEPSPWDVRPGQQNGRMEIPGEDWARRLPGGKTGMYTREQVAGWAARAGRASGQTGHHWNKSGYYRNTPDGPAYIWPGMRSVRNRRRNPANARATRRAIGRIDGAKRMAKDLSRITIRKKC